VGLKYREIAPRTAAGLSRLAGVHIMLTLPIGAPCPTARTVSNAVDENFATFMHTADPTVTLAPIPMVWANIDMTGSSASVLPISRFYLLPRVGTAASPTCLLYLRDFGHTVYVGVDADVPALTSTSMVGPQANLCGKVSDLTNYMAWSGVECEAATGPYAYRLGRFVTVRRENTAVTGLPSFGSSACSTSSPQQYIQFSEAKVFSSRCAALPNLVSGIVSFANGAYGGCGAAGTPTTSAVWTGSTCTQTCVAPQVRVGGGDDGAAQTCANGEWITAGRNGGPLVCSLACPALVAPAFLSNAAACTTTMINESFTATTGLAAWYPRWKMYRTGGASALPQSEQEYGMLFTGGVGLLQVTIEHGRYYHG
jgi:hypothetical protein